MFTKDQLSLIYVCLENEMKEWKEEDKVRLKKTWNDLQETKDKVNAEFYSLEQ